MYGTYTMASAISGKPVSSTIRRDRTGTISPLIMPRNAPTMISAISPVSRFLPTIAFGRARPMRYVRRGMTGWDWVVNALLLLCGCYLSCLYRRLGWRGCCAGCPRWVPIRCGAEVRRRGQIRRRPRSRRCYGSCVRPPRR